MSADIEDRIRDLAESHDPTATDLRADLARGQRALRRRRGWLAVTCSATAAVIVGGSVWAAAVLTADRQPHGPGRSVVSPAGSGGPTAATSQQPKTSPRDAIDKLQRMTIDYRRNLYVTTKRYLDPRGQHLRFDPSGIVATGDASDLRAVGIKMSWKTAASRGEGLVMINVGLPAPDEFQACGAYLLHEAECTKVTLPNGRTAKVYEAGGSISVEYQQPRGDVVTVDVDPLFANNSMIPVTMSVTRAQVLALVQDAKLQLPWATYRDLHPKLLPASTMLRTARKHLDPSSAHLLLEYGSGRLSDLHLSWLTAGRRAGYVELISQRISPSTSPCDVLFNDPKPGICRTRVVDGQRVSITRSTHIASWAVQVRRPDGYYVEVQIMPTSGNIPVTLHQAVALVTDPALRL